MDTDWTGEGDKEQLKGEEEETNNVKGGQGYERREGGVICPRKRRCNQPHKPWSNNKWDDVVDGRSKIRHGRETSQIHQTQVEKTWSQMYV